MSSRFHPVAVMLMLALLCDCARPPAENGSSSVTSQKLPFDGKAPATGVSPSHSLIPSPSRLPEGTPIPIRLQNALSSASSHAGDTFSATVDEPVVIDGETVVERGTPAIGRVLEANPATSSGGNSLGRVREPGYLRIVLVSISVGGKPVIIETSSIFAKGGSREPRKPANGGASGQNRHDNEDIVFGVDRHLNFRLAQTVDLQ